MYRAFATLEIILSILLRTRGTIHMPCYLLINKVIISSQLELKEVGAVAEVFYCKFSLTLIFTIVHTSQTIVSMSFIWG